MPPTLLMRMRKIQVLSDERPSNAHMPWITPTQVSGTCPSPEPHPIQWADLRDSGEGLQGGEGW
jgi:hypothetical protein